MARTFSQGCTVDKFNECKSDYCCLGEDALLTVIAYLFAESYSPGINVNTLLATAGWVSPALFTNRDYLIALACLAANEASNEQGGIDVYAAAQKAGFNKLSPDQLRVIIVFTLCLLLNPPN